MIAALLITTTLLQATPPAPSAAEPSSAEPSSAEPRSTEQVRATAAFSRSTLGEQLLAGCGATVVGLPLLCVPFGWVAHGVAVTWAIVAAGDRLSGRRGSMTKPLVAWFLFTQVGGVGAFTFVVGGAVAAFGLAPEAAFGLLSTRPELFIGGLYAGLIGAAIASWGVGVFATTAAYQLTAEPAAPGAPPFIPPMRHAGESMLF